MLIYARIEIQLISGGEPRNLAPKTLFQFPLTMELVSLVPRIFAPIPVLFHGALTPSCDWSYEIVLLFPP
jgi:hypothetical protein